MAKITFGTANGRKLNKHHIPITSIGTFAVDGRQVTGCIPLTRGDKVKGTYSQFSRLAPLVCPTFGSFNLKTMAFFVPAHTIWRGYRSWVSGSVDSSVPNAPLNFSLEDLAYLLTGSANPFGSTSWNPDYFDISTETYETPATSNLENYDFLMINTALGNDEGHACNFNAAGRALWNTLICLGYNFPTEIVLDMGNIDQAAYYQDLNYNIFPFMAYARVCYDHLYPSRYVNQQGFSFLFETALNSGWSNAATRRSYIVKMAETWFNQYDQDFYTSLWSKPNQSAVGNGSTLNQSFSDQPILGASVDITSSPSFTSVVATQNSSSSVLSFSSDALRWLTSVSDFVLRNNIGGARFREFMKSHFGYNTDNDICDESVFIKMWSDEVRISDVTNTTGGISGSALGELAGKGYSSSKGDNKFSFEAKEAGFLLFVTECKPNVGYYQGNRPWARALNDRFQLYTPEFDGVGMEGVPKQAIFSSYERSSDDASVSRTSLNDAFGFAPRYSERYKVGHDNLFGDFRLRSRGRNMDSWHTMRDVLYGRDSANPLALDSAFLHVDTQYQRIFQYIGNNQGDLYDQDDKIWTFLGFDITKYSTAKSLGNSLPFFEENGREAHMNYEGSDIK